ncbi:GlxA family transcriptional regulator [Nocardia crassostreae]|uniref:GlxA family transcriptional regulator n=1 Tax=Nocardia crassostreae TaxID=53428 RepID=UPI00082E9463|nr:helix-turn-helix domain-containing protein [Nocardia crassostreae]
MSAGSVALVVPAEIGLSSWDMYELSIPATIFGRPQPDLSPDWYSLRQCGTTDRPGGQAQFIDLSIPATDDQTLTPVLDWARANLDQPLTIEDLARRAAVSPCTLYRRLQESTGTTPLQWLLNQRLSRAQTLLETTHLSIEKVAALSGLGTANNLRHHFLKQIGISPTDYRRAFPCPPDTPAPV